MAEEHPDIDYLYNPDARSRCWYIYVERMTIYVSEQFEDVRIPPLDRQVRAGKFNDDHGRAVCNIINHYQNIFDELCRSAIVLARRGVEEFILYLEEEVFSGGCTAANLFVFLSLVARLASRLYALGEKYVRDSITEIVVDRLVDLNPRFTELGGWCAVEAVLNYLLNQTGNISKITPLNPEVLAGYLYKHSS